MAVEPEVFPGEPGGFFAAVQVFAGVVEGGALPRSVGGAVDVGFGGEVDEVVGWNIEECC